MSSSLFSLILTAALGQLPLPFAGGGAFSGGMLARPYAGEYTGDSASYVGGSTSAGAFGANEPFYPFDAYEPWTHGYFQEMPAYGGYHFFRPFNYKHVMAQSQVAAGWGMSPTMPYSQEYFLRHQYGANQRRYGQRDPNYGYEQLPPTQAIPVSRGGYIEQTGGYVEQAPVYLGPNGVPMIQQPAPQQRKAASFEESVRRSTR